MFQKPHSVQLLVSNEEVMECNRILTFFPSNSQNVCTNTRPGADKEPSNPIKSFKKMLMHKKPENLKKDSNQKSH